MKNNREFPESETLATQIPFDELSDSFSFQEESLQTVVESFNTGHYAPISWWGAFVTIWGLAFILGLSIGSAPVQEINLPSCLEVSNSLWRAYLPKNAEAPLEGIFRGYQIMVSANSFIIELENEEVFSFDCSFNGQDVKYLVIPPVKEKL